MLRKVTAHISLQAVQLMALFMSMRRTVWDALHTKVYYMGFGKEGNPYYWL